MTFVRSLGFRCGKFAFVASACWGLSGAMTLVQAAPLESKVSSRQVADYGAFPLRWLEGTEDVYPVARAPREVQREAWMANRRIARDGAMDEIRFETAAVDGAKAQEQAQKLENYWVEHHHYPESRMVHEATLPAAWAGWVVVRSSASRALPPTPPARLTAWLNRLPAPALVGAMPPVSGMALAASAPVASDAIVTSQAAALSPARFESEMTLDPAHGVRRSVFAVRPFAALELFSCEGWRTNRTEPKASASWIGPRLGFDARIAEAPIAVFGASGSFYRSVTPVTIDALNSKAQEIEGSAWMTLRANSIRYGIPQVRLGAGYLSNRRWGVTESGGSFLPSFAGARFSGEIATELDAHFTLALHGAFTAAQAGLYEAGGQLTHNLFRLREQQWDLTFGMNAAVARAATDLGPQTQETWLSFQLGLSGGI